MPEEGLVVTIARQNGSGGREVGQKLAHRLGIGCYDQEIISETAKRSGIPVEEVSREEERPRHSTFTFYGVEAMNPVFNMESDTIREIASREPAVIVGRCGDYVLNGRPNTVRVFIHAPIDKRVSRSASRNGISPEEAIRRIQRKDSDRECYYNRHTGRLWGNVQNYDLAINTGVIGIDGAVDLICDYIRMLNKNTQ